MPRTIDEKTKTATKEFITSPIAAEVGICSTCNHAPECVNLKAAGQPIWFCDQFDAYIPPSPESKPVSVPATAAPSPNGGEEGLCQHCANRAQCVNRTPGTAIWHCEEYC